VMANPAGHTLVDMYDERLPQMNESSPSSSEWRDSDGKRCWSHPYRHNDPIPE
jgi:hypothetical protein